MPGKLKLIVEGAEDGSVWGRIMYKGDLLTSSAENVKALEASFKEQLEGFYDLSPADINFEIEYDIQGFFDMHSYLNISAIAEKAEINKALLRQYATGHKYPSSDQVTKIKKAIHEIGKDLSRVNIVPALK